MCVLIQEMGGGALDMQKPLTARRGGSVQAVRGERTLLGGCPLFSLLVYPPLNILHALRW